MVFRSFGTYFGCLLAALTCGLIQVATAEVSFLPAANLDVGNRPEAIAVGAFRGAGNPLDLAVVNGASNTVSVLLGNGDGTFQDPVHYGVGEYPWFVVAADLNDDQVLDLVVSNRDSSSLTVLMGVGDGSFTVDPDFGTVPLTEQAFSTAVGDFNSDSIPDLVVTNWSDAFLLIGNGDGTFQPPIVLDAGRNALFAAIGDFNEDNIPDLAVTNWPGDRVTILLGHGDATFEQVGNYAIG